MAQHKITCIGEAMLEFAPVGDGLFRQGFAGDTMNTCWHLAQLLGDRGQVRYLTKVGTDPYSDRLLTFLASDGVAIDRIARDPDRRLGLYVIDLNGTERSFTYWRDTSAARRLADDAVQIETSIGSSELVFVSGITLAIIEDQGRRNLFAALSGARSRGALVAFDPNVRLRLWPDETTVRAATAEMLKVTDIALPSFDDEARLWGDTSPEATVARLSALGVTEIVVKDGAGDVVSKRGQEVGSLPTPPVAGIRDTTGAGDAFNAGYLAARLMGHSRTLCCVTGQSVAAEVLKVFGALTPKEELQTIRQSLFARANG